MVFKAVIQGVRYFVSHMPDLVRYGSKPTREIREKPSLLNDLQDHLRSYNQAVGYPPLQVLIGNLATSDLSAVPRPWFQNLRVEASAQGPFGEIARQEEFYGVLKAVDDFQLICLAESFLSEMRFSFERHPLVTEADVKKLGKGLELDEIEKKIATGNAIPLFQRGKVIGCLKQAHAEDPNLGAEVLLENLTCKAAATMALRGLLKQDGYRAEKVQFILGCGEEAVGDRYNRGGGNLAKAIGEGSGCLKAGGLDVKSFCSAPVHALMVAGSLVADGIFEQVAVVGGCSLAKLGMKFLGHLARNMPILEDVLVGAAILVGQDDGTSPIIRLDSVGKVDIGSSSSQQGIMEKLVSEPVRRLGLRLSDIDKYATELHDPDITEPVGSGDVPRTNYRMIAALAALNNEIGFQELDRFVEAHGMVGFSPTQGHIASAIPFLGHALAGLRSGKLSKVMLLSKGSLFLGRMTQMSDGASLIIERNGEA